MIPFAELKRERDTRGGSSTVREAVRPGAAPRRGWSVLALASAALGAPFGVLNHFQPADSVAFWSPELDAVITGTINTGRVDCRPLLGAVVRALTD